MFCSNEESSSRTISEPVSCAGRNVVKIQALTLAILIFGASVLTAQDKTDNGERIRYVAIGDSYSIGEGASSDQSWPAVLTRHLNAQGVPVDLVANPSVTGWTTQQAIDRELPIFIKSKPTFATLQIGVNDWVQGVDETTFRKRFVLLVDQMLAVLPDKKRLVIVTIPDFGVTPTGGRYARGRNISEGLTRFNEIINEEVKRRGLKVVDVFPASKAMKDDRSLVAADGLHPSANEYAEWEKLIFPIVLELMKKKSAIANKGMGMRERRDGTNDVIAGQTF
jgi:acyl-CoA thioesterase I